MSFILRGRLLRVCFYSSPDGCFRYPQRAMRRASERPSRSPPLGRIDSPSGKCQGLGGDLRFLLFNVFLAGLDPEESLPVLGRTIWMGISRMRAQATTMPWDIPNVNTPDWRGGGFRPLQAWSIWRLWEFREFRRGPRLFCRRASFLACRALLSVCWFLTR